ncbi:uracil-DNA glycosylase [Horticoccus luteus]|uniref:Type-4 uracil-DNA glycosylase n=1 Tax=Horticoccus luteus TaxID=2862869 RepID=A0A8F9TU84_9BACT|nr:uracil-DNA glycosylase [Horticoccus luteus]QYM77672.1 uracil-DNA glycosylase [Horticoccus luteus]
MRTALLALAAELKRLKADGVKSVAVEEATLATLRRAVAAQKNARVQPAGESPVQPEPIAADAPESSTNSSAPPSPLPRAAAARAQDDTIPAPPVFALPEGDKRTQWEALRERVLGDPVCNAHVRPGKKVVFGTGNLDASIMLVGEAPGADEEVAGEPFVGPAGQLLTRMVAGMGLQREQVYIGNIMNWRPQMPMAGGGDQTGNRPPTAQEMGYCLPYLKAQIDVVKPALLVALGSTAAHGLLGLDSFRTLGEVRGRWHEFAGTPLMVTYHPSYILREPTNRKKRMIWDDLLKVMERAGLPISEKQRGFFL